MKRILFFLVVFAAQFSWAQDISDKRKAFFEHLEGCGQAVYSDSEWFVTSLPNTANGIGHVRIQSLVDANKSFDFPAQDTVVDAKIKDGKLYILTETTFEAWDIANYKSLFQYPSILGITKADHWAKKAYGFAIAGDKALIAHGVLGISIVDLKSGVKYKKIPMLSNSLAQDITLLDASTAAVVVDNGDEGQFRGIYLIDLGSLAITKQIKIDNAYPLSIRLLPNNRLMVGYINAIWKFDLGSVLTKTEATPNRISWVFPGLGNVDMRGKVFYDDKYLYSCFYWVDAYNDHGIGFTAPHPLVFKLDDLRLN